MDIIYYLFTAEMSYNIKDLSALHEIDLFYRRAKCYAVAALMGIVR